ncbi:hypothetical protein BFW38_03350 [Terasakiispira papahanaumokuakeensis]|uniref:Uncharacterized protein n=2 Tax=Terasakiispira papahanaumokuakeensis TaxID=197479 RepID=A0A1E2V6X4_9GAMM|nr:hypothetical protein BFW38_03350 [Terasakiispira papahanaumokuakeensis]
MITEPVMIWPNPLPLRLTEPIPLPSIPPPPVVNLDLIHLLLRYQHLLEQANNNRTEIQQRWPVADDGP